MRHLFARGNAGVLAQLAWTHLLLAFDYDGTLAPIVVDRDRAIMRSRTTALLARVAALYPTALVSGRAQADVAALVRGLPVRYLVGNHGIEPSAAADLRRFETEVGQVHALLAQQLAGRSGIEIEDKRYSLAVHYRRARTKRATRAAIEEAVAALPMAMRIVRGKQVVNVVPATAAHKGDAIIRLRATEGASTVLYVGDDITDEDVFALDQPGRLVTVRVGASPTTAATYYLRDQREIDRLLAELVRLR